MDKAGRTIEAARRELEAGEAGFAADRAYYAMFYVAEALLSQRGLEFSSHGAVHGAFGKEFARTGVLDPEFHRGLLDAFRTRQMAIYDVTIELSPDAAEALITRAADFLGAAREFLEGTR
ncbi:MAG TPA: HEPN domain-containing protein [Longimicrobiaceae bacterium]|nr:HEPN domain-containing protein [Longimicrobiaceae bacterium]